MPAKKSDAAAKTGSVLGSLTGSAAKTTGTAAKNSTPKKTAAAAKKAPAARKPAAKKASAPKKTPSGTGKRAPASGSVSGKAAGAAFTLTAAEKKLVTLYRSADKETKDRVLRLLKGESTDTGDVLGNLANAALEMLNRN